MLLSSAAVLRAGGEEWELEAKELAPRLSLQRGKLQPETFRLGFCSKVTKTRKSPFGLETLDRKVLLCSAPSLTPKSCKV